MKSFQLVAVLLGIVMLFAANIDARAQQISLSSATDKTAIELSAIDNPEAVRALVSRLSDNEVRDLLLQQLDVVAAKQNTEINTDEVSLFALITTSIPVSVLAAVSQLPVMIPGLIAMLATFFNSLGPNGWINLLGAFCAALVAGFIVEILVRRITIKWRSTV